MIENLSMFLCFCIIYFYSSLSVKCTNYNFIEYLYGVTPNALTLILFSHASFFISRSIFFYFLKSKKHFYKTLYILLYIIFFVAMYGVFLRAGEVNCLVPIPNLFIDSIFLGVTFLLQFLHNLKRSGSFK